MSPLVSLLKKDKKNLIIAPESFHEGFFKETLKEDYLYDLSFASETDFIDDVLGYYTIDAAFFLMEEEKISFDAATSLLSSFPFMDNLWKKDLEKFHKSPLNLKTNYENKSIIYLKKAEANPAFLLALNKLKEIGITANSYAFPVCENPNYSFTIYPTIISEVEDLAEKVSALLAQGVKPDSILIEPSDEDYYTVIEDIFSFSQIPYFVNHPLSLYELEDVSRYLEFLKDEKANPTQESLNAFKAKYYLDESVYRALQKAVLTPYASKRESFISLLRSTSFKKKEMSGAIKIGHYFDGYIDDDSHLFILGASLGVFPKPINLMGLLTKEVLSKGNLPSLKELNSNYEDYFINRFLSLKNVILSCPKKTIQREVSPSKIIELIPSIQINEWKINSTRYS